MNKSTEELMEGLRKLPLGTKNKRFGDDEYLCLSDGIVKIILKLLKDMGYMKVAGWGVTFIEGEEIDIE